MSSARTTWGIGAYPQMAECLEPAARRAADLAELAPGMHVLDVGCGPDASLTALDRHTSTGVPR